MKITQDCIAPDLRIPGRFYHFLDGLYPARMTMPSLPDWMAEWKSDPKENLYNRFLEREDGSQLRLLVHKPKRSLAKPLPVVFWIHGGGYALGMPEMMYLSLVRTIMENCVIVSCDYTLSGQKGFPAGLEDCWKTAGRRWSGPENTPGNWAAEKTRSLWAEKAPAEDWPRLFVFWPESESR